MGVVVLIGSAGLAQEAAVLPAGIALPKKGSMYAIDQKATENVLVQLHATEIVHNMQAGANAVRSLVYVGQRASVELNGLNAAVHLEGKNVVLLARLGDDASDLMRSRLALVRLKQGGNRRLVCAYSQNIFGGQRKREYDIISVTKVDLPDSDWVEMVPEKPLDPGEYGIVLMPKDATLFPDAVYDFDVAIHSAKPEK